MNPFLLKLLTGLGISAGGSIIQNLLGRSQAKRELEINKQMLDYQNQYNSPQEQMKRLKNAGLNPNLVYGSQNVSGNLTGNLPRYQEQAKVFDTSGINSVIQAQLSEASIDKTLKDIEKTESDIKTQEQIRKLDELRAQLVAKELGIADTKAEIEKLNLNTLSKIAPYTISSAEKSNEKLNTEIINLVKQGEILDENKQNVIQERILILKRIQEMGLSIDKETKLLQMLKDGTSPENPFLLRQVNSVSQMLGFDNFEDLKDYFKGAINFGKRKR